MLIVAYDFASLCDVSGRGAYSSEPRKGYARSERPDPSLCEITEIGRLQVAKMLKLLIALGLLTQVRRAGMNQQAIYAATIPQRGVAEYSQCLAVAAELGFKPRTKRDTTKATQERRRRKAHGKASGVSEEAPQTAVEEPVDNRSRDVVRTTPRERRADDAPGRRADDVPRHRADDGPLPIGGLGNRGTTCSHLGTGPRGARTGAEKEDQLGSGEERDPGPVMASPDTVDGQPAGNRWGTAVSQAAIRQAGRDRAREESANAGRCQGLDGKGCKYDRPVSPSNDKGLCIRCYGLIAEPDDSPGSPPGAPDQPLSFDTPEMPPPSYGTEDGERS
ncbi:hypothetical protein ACFV42_23080 [Streptomyces solisilvae]|uniref:hypothetical protein n=1 Tax=Streptomyces malaysiensis TaxID=92644 RepID=UPI0036B44840